MDLQTFMLLAMKNKAFTRLEFLRSIFAIIVPTQGEYERVPYEIYVIGTKYMVDINDEAVELTVPFINAPLISSKVTFSLSNKDLPNIKGNIQTSASLLVLNYMTINYALGAKLPYVNKPFSPRDLEEMYTPLLVGDTAAASDKTKVSVSEMKLLANVIRMLESTSSFTTVSATLKTIVPAPGMEAFVNRIKGEYDLTNPLDIAKFEDRIVAFDAEYLKDDPSMGKLMGAKGMRSRKRLYAVYGAEAGLTSEAVPYNIKPLRSGIPTDAKMISAARNIARAGSANRGQLTVKGGVASKTIIQATDGLTVAEDDCKTKKIIMTKLTVDTFMKYRHRYGLVNGKPTLMENVKAGDTIALRTPLHCQTTGNGYCKTCVGKKLSARAEGIPIATGVIGRKLLGYYMSLFHGAVYRHTTVSSIEDIFV